jgi:hypothetical protein
MYLRKILQGVREGGAVNDEIDEAYPRTGMEKRRLQRIGSR